VRRERQATLLLRRERCSLEFRGQPSFNDGLHEDLVKINTEKQHVAKVPRDLEAPQIVNLGSSGIEGHKDVAANG
jgi:hypothetical protein